eukprot:GGOE01037143.1.p1 GENE.GGOE01037143.1~~GGOE01037143.1.p1  ORF type:complete len:454 (-),score=114.60 GGOE01037143.1:197-1558(-)
MNLNWKLGAFLALSILSLLGLVYGAPHLLRTLDLQDEVVGSLKVTVPSRPAERPPDGPPSPSPISAPALEPPVQDAAGASPAPSPSPSAPSPSPVVDALPVPPDAPSPLAAAAPRAGHPHPPNHHHGGRDGAPSVARPVPAGLNPKRARLCGPFVRHLARKEDGERVCDRLREYHSCKKLGGGKQGKVYRCYDGQQQQVVVKHGNRPRDNMARNEVLMACELGLLRDFQVADTFVDVYDYCWCDKGHGDIEVFANSSHPITVAGAFTVLELVATDPWGTHNGFDVAALFELLYGILAAHLTVHANVRDLQAKHFGWSQEAVPRRYIVGNASLALPPGRRLRIFDLATFKMHHVRQDATANQVLQASKYLHIFGKSGYTTAEAHRLYDWTKAHLTGLSPVAALEAVIHEIHTQQLLPNAFDGSSGEEEAAREVRFRLPSDMTAIRSVYPPVNSP